MNNKNRIHIPPGNSKGILSFPDEVKNLFYKLSSDKKGLLGYFTEKEYFHIHSDELTKEQKIIHRSLLKRSNMQLKENEVIIRSPIKVIPSKNYMLVIEDCEGTRHYWHNKHDDEPKKKGGEYDGYDKGCKEKSI